MPFTRERFSLFWSLPPDGQDWSNLRLARVRRMQLVAAFADPGTLTRLRSEGVTGVAVRLGEGDYATPQLRQHWRDRIAPLVPLGVDMVIVGVEPEHPFNMRYGSPSWGQMEAFVHRDNVNAMLGLLRPLGVRVVSPGWTSRAKDMNWQEGLFPGEQSWLEITRTVYNNCDLNGFHWYSYDGTAYDMLERMRRTLWMEQCRRHKALYIGEVGVATGTQVQRMTVYLQLATRMLGTNTAMPFFRSGERVEALVPFISNGTPVGWDPGFLIRDPAAYALVGRFMAGQNF